VVAALFASTLVVVGAADTTAVAASNGQVVALDPMSGAQRWAADLGFPAIGTPPASADGHLYVVGVSSCESAMPTVAALRTTDGCASWQVKLPVVANVGGPLDLVADRGMVVFALSGQPNGLVEALDASTGKLRWKAHPGHESFFVIGAGDVLVVYGYTAPYSQYGVKVTAYDLKTGRPRMTRWPWNFVAAS
jgi:outer membrane protein assembly factor BamB